MLADTYAYMPTCLGGVTEDISSKRLSHKRAMTDTGL